VLCTTTLNKLTPDSVPLVTKTRAVDEVEGLMGEGAAVSTSLTGNEQPLEEPPGECSSCGKPAGPQTGQRDR
jgi:hypothetical protein